MEIVKSDGYVVYPAEEVIFQAYALDFDCQDHHGRTDDYVEVDHWSDNTGRNEEVSFPNGHTDIWTKWIAPDAPGSYTLTARASDAGTIYFPDGTGTDSITIHVVEMDLDIDGVSDEEEETVGHFQSFNNDDDNSNSVADKDESGTVTGENDLVPITLTMTPAAINTGSVKLEAVSGGGNIQIWETATKGTQVTLPKTWDLTTETVPTTLYVEGIAASSGARDVGLKLSYLRNGTTEIAFDEAKDTVMQVNWQEDASQSYGFDNHTNAFIPWKSVRDSSFTDIATAIITPGMSANQIFFASQTSGNIDVSPANASGSPQTVTFTGLTTKGESDVYARLGSDTGPNTALIKAKAYKTYPVRTLAIRVIHEEDDDVQVISIAQGKPDTDAIDTGADGICQTTVSGDDAQIIPVGQGLPNQEAITAGPNNAIDSIVSGDDEEKVMCITTGDDGVCNTVAIGDDVQVIPLGQGAPNIICIKTGSDGVCNSGSTSDDTQLISLNHGSPNEICVGPGANAKRDTKPNGDDQVSGENVTTGADGICNTVADNTNELSIDPYDATTLQDFLNNTVYKQSVMTSWQVTKLQAMTVNWDLDCDDKINVSTWTTAEMNVIINQCDDANYNYIIFYVDPPNDGSYGFMDLGQKYGFVHAGTSPRPLCTAPHELGHGAFSLVHGSGLGINENLMTQGSQYKWRLFKNQWETIQGGNN